MLSIYNLLKSDHIHCQCFIIPHTSTFIRLSRLYQEFCVHCIVIMSDGGIWDRWEVVDSYQGVGGWVSSHSFFYLCFCLLVSHVLSLFFSE